MLTAVVVKLQVEGFHSWPDCDLKEVDFLKNRHRHIFHVTCKKIVSHENRDIEIILLKRKMQKALHENYGTPCEFGAKSCEMIASWFCRIFELYSCEVLEDGENGAEVWYE